MMPGSVGVDLILGRTGEVVLTVGAIRAYRNGFQFTVTGLVRAASVSDRGGMGWRVRVDVESGPLITEFCQVGVEFSNGLSAANRHWHPPASGSVPTGLLLVALAGGGAGHRFEVDYWVWPLPPPGPVTFVCGWPTHSLAETRTAIDAGAILDAAARCVEFWRAEP
jgi:hypothetical protein